MTQFNTVNVKSFNSQPNKLKPAIKNGTEVNLILSSNLIGKFNDETNFPHRLLLKYYHYYQKYSEEDLYLVYHLL